MVKLIFHSKVTAFKGKNLLPLGANSFLKREVPILKKWMQLKRITDCSSSLPLMCVTFSVFWPLFIVGTPDVAIVPVQSREEDMSNTETTHP